MWQWQGGEVLSPSLIPCIFPDFQPAIGRTIIPGWLTKLYNPEILSAWEKAWLSVQTTLLEFFAAATGAGIISADTSE